MTRAGRALLGAMLGAALTLVVHPASRPFLFSAFLSPSHRAAAAQKGIPSDLVDLSDWMAATGDRFVNRKPLSKVELQNAIAAARKGAQLNPDNAFWHQVLACFYHQLGDEKEAAREWGFAAACVRWSDFQTTELLREHERLAVDFGAPQSWQLAYVYYQRSENTVAMISSYARRVLDSAPLMTDQGLLVRAKNVINGGLLRKGSQNIRIGGYGADMAEAACHPPEISANKNRHKLFLLRVSMQDRLRTMGEPTLAELVNSVYRESDGWDAYEVPQDAADDATQLSFLSLFFVGFPSMLLVVGAIGLFLWGVGHSLRRLDRIELIPALVAGLLLGFGAFMITLLPLAAVATFLCSVFLTLGPKRERRVKIDDLGPMFSFTAGTLGLVFMFLFGAFIVGTSAPAVSLLPFLTVPHEYFGGSGVLLGLSIIVLAILLLLAPLFAIALRVGTSFVLSQALKKFGAFLAYSSLTAIVIGTPLCIYFDRDNAETLQRIVSNEPLYHLNLQR